MAALSPLLVRPAGTVACVVVSSPDVRARSIMQLAETMQERNVLVPVAELPYRPCIHADSDSILLSCHIRE